MTDSWNIEENDHRMAHQAELEEAEAEKHFREMEFEKLINQSCFDPKSQRCRSGECGNCKVSKLKTNLAESDEELQEQENGYNHSRGL